MARQINADGREKIKRWERLDLTAYKCPAGEWTIGYGHTSNAGPPKVTPGMKITKEQAEDILTQDLSVFEKRVERLVKVPLTDSQFAALVSFDFNTGKLHSSTLLKKLNTGDYGAVPVELMKWVKADGKKLDGLVNRRSAEVGLWSKGSYVSSNYQEVEQEKKSFIKTKNAVGIGAASVGATGTAIMDAANHIQPLAEIAPSLKWVFIGLTVAGVLFGLYANIKRVKEESA